MLNKSDMPALEGLINGSYITESDSEIIKLVSENEDLKILQSKDSYNWITNSGKTEHILSMARTRSLTHLDVILGLFVVDKDKLEETGNSYAIESNLFSENFSKKDSVPNLSKLQLSFNYLGEDVYLSEYSIIKSERYIEYPSKKEDIKNLNKTTLAKLYSEDLKKALTVFYGQAFNNGELLGSWIDLLDKEGFKMLDMDKNVKLVGFMSALDYWHDNKLNEGKAKVKKFGTGPNVPSYLSLYY